MISMEDDIVAVGGSLDETSLLQAYRQGVFPWPAEGLPLLWYCPLERAILRFEKLHIGRNLMRARKKSQLRFTIDAAFDRVIGHCAAIERPDQDATWINPEMILAYRQLHTRGIAHSVEAWEGERLVGGLYGIDCGGSFSGESMFHLVPDASRLALLYLIDHLERRGCSWIDCQVMTPHFERLGAEEVPREFFLRELASALAAGSKLFA
jgi:leucyl/phenylalanyl-tRNA--protein transferase